MNIYEQRPIGKVYSHPFRRLPQLKKWEYTILVIGVTLFSLGLIMVFLHGLLGIFF